MIDKNNMDKYIEQQKKVFDIIHTLTLNAVITKPEQTPNAMYYKLKEMERLLQPVIDYLEVNDG